MKIYIMRHGEAQVFAPSDEQRALTEYGMQSCYQQGTWLKNTALSFDKVIVSPYLRAQQSFQQINQAFDNQLGDKMEEWEGITPYGYADNVIAYLEVLREQGVESILLVSHLPLVGDIVIELCGKNPISFLPATIAELEWHGGKATFLQGKKP